MKISDYYGLGVSQQNSKIISNISAEFSLKVSNHKVGNLSLKGCVGDSRLVPCLWTEIIY
ncbi:MAG: hypothetical protein LBK82_16430 [Planctomycetaceae bacterium]|nr:hypothetical protein [Planctomycetaceae bacterium]